MRRSGLYARTSSAQIHASRRKPSCACTCSPCARSLLVVAASFAAPLRPQTPEGRERLHCSTDSCDYVFYDNPVPVVAALVEHGQTVLLVRGKGWPEKWYGLVTGFLEKGESPEEGVLREVRE